MDAALDALPWPSHALELKGKGFRILGTPSLFVARLGDKLVLPGEVVARLRLSLHVAAGGMCHYCRIDMRLECEAGPNEIHRIVTIEHRHPLARGGTWKRSNLAAACYRCNAAKGDLTEAEYLALIEAHPAVPSGQHIGRIRRAARANQGQRAKEANRILRETLALAPKPEPQ